MIHGRVRVTGGGEIKVIIANLEDGAKPPSFRVVTRMEQVLRSGFADTQARTHIISGSLKASGKVSSDFDGRTWTGKIEYGGPLTKAPIPGPPRDPVDYAIYEMRRGGAHDFYGGLLAYEEQFEDAINEFFPG